MLPGLQVPIYDFKESRRVGYRTVQVPESRVVIIEGIYALSQRIRWVGGLPAWDKALVVAGAGSTMEQLVLVWGVMYVQC